MHRFFISPKDFQTNPVRFPPEQARQILRVLRLQAGTAVVALDGLGQQAVVRLQHDTEGVWGDVLERRPATGEPPTQVQLFFSVTQRDKLEWILQKGTEAGVSEFHPFISSRSLVQKKNDDKLGRWLKIVKEAAEQSGRGRIPEVHTPQPVYQLLARPVAENSLRLIAWEQERSRSLRAALAGASPACVEVWIGPEGGFAASEVELAQQNGALPFSLGPRILRMETAAMIAPALVLYELDNASNSEP